MSVPLRRAAFYSTRLVSAKQYDSSSAPGQSAVLQQQRARILGQRLRSSDTRSDGGEGGSEHDSERHPRRGMSSRAVSTLGTVPS